jgi:isopentenyldiphosphate isomerase
MNKRIQIVDEDDNSIGSATMDEAQTKGLRHRIVRIMVEDENGNVLLQKRGPHMETAPNLWDHSAAGHVDEGEDYTQAAHRELAEETGVTGAIIQEVGSYKSNDVLDGRILNRSNKVYRVIVDAGVALKPQAEEVAELRWFTKTEINRLLADHPEQVTGGLRYVIKHFF